MLNKLGSGKSETLESKKKWIGNRGLLGELELEGRGLPSSVAVGSGVAGAAVVAAHGDGR